MDTYRSDETADLRRQIENLQENIAAYQRANSRMAEKLHKAEREAESVRYREERSVRNAIAMTRVRNFTHVSIRVVAGVLAISAPIFLAAWGIDSCNNSRPPITRGVITDRYDDPAYTTPAYTTTVCSGSGSSRHCTHVYHPPVYHPERWAVEVSHDGRSRFVEMPVEHWNNTHVGDSWCEDPHDPCDLNRVERAR